ncbi:MAG TPA: hypothetical protein VII27_00870 [Thermoplasmata archaeon]
MKSSTSAASVQEGFWRVTPTRFPFVLPWRHVVSPSFVSAPSSSSFQGVASRPSSTRSPPSR